MVEIEEIDSDGECEIVARAPERPKINEPLPLFLFSSNKYCRENYGKISTRFNAFWRTPGKQKEASSPEREEEACSATPPRESGAAPAPTEPLPDTRKNDSPTFNHQEYDLQIIVHMFQRVFRFFKTKDNSIEKYEEVLRKAGSADDLAEIIINTDDKTLIGNLCLMAHIEEAFMFQRIELAMELVMRDIFRDVDKPAFVMAFCAMIFRGNLEITPKVIYVLERLKISNCSENVRFVVRAALLRCIKQGAPELKNKLLKTRGKK